MEAGLTGDRPTHRSGGRSLTAGTLAGVLTIGMLILGATDCAAQSTAEVAPSVENYGVEDWARYLQEMEEEFGRREGYEILPEPPASLMVSVWSDFLRLFPHDDPHSERDDELRRKAEKRLAFWKGQGTPTSDAPPGELTEESAGNLYSCLNHLESSAPPGAVGGLRLGRIIQNQEITGPVLLRTNANGYSYRRCSGDGSTEVEVAQANFQFFNSALVARFRHEGNVTLKQYRKVLKSSSYEEAGEVELRFRGAGSMLEARRQGVDYVEVAHFPPKRVTILLIATRTAMRSMEPSRWEESWGDRHEDLRIEREIIWWELASPTGAKVYPAVGSFVELEGFLGGENALSGDEAVGNDRADGTDIEWSHILGDEGDKDHGVEDLKHILARGKVFSLFIVEELEHIELADSMFKLAEKMKADAELDVGTREDRWRKKQRERLEKTADWGRYLPLVRLKDLAIIMPDRIAGKIRSKYYQSNESADSTENHVTLETYSQRFQVANAIFLDQAARMVKTLNFLGCLLESDAEGPGRREVLERGLERMNIPIERRGELEEMDVREAFKHLFQGFSLPPDLPAAELDFLSSISSRDFKVSRLVRSLLDYLGTTSFKRDPSCEVALISDSFLLGPPFDDPPVVVSSLPALKYPRPDLMDSTLPIIPDRCDEARQAEIKTRDALKDAIIAKAARHTRAKIEKGYKPFDNAVKILIETNCKDTRRAIRLFKKATKNFVNAKETAGRIEHIKPKVRVH